MVVSKQVEGNMGSRTTGYPTASATPCFHPCPVLHCCILYVFLVWINGGTLCGCVCQLYLSVTCCAPGTRPAFSRQPHSLPAPGHLNLLVSTQEAAAHLQCQWARVASFLTWILGWKVASQGGILRHHPPSRAERPFPQLSPLLEIVHFFVPGLSSVFPRDLSWEVPVQSGSAGLSMSICWMNKRKERKINSVRIVGRYWQVGVQLKLVWDFTCS